MPNASRVRECARLRYDRINWRARWRMSRRAIASRLTREAPRNVEQGRPCDRRPANQLFSFVVPPSSFPVRVHAEAAGPTGCR